MSKTAANRGARSAGRAIGMVVLVAGSACPDKAHRPQPDHGSPAGSPRKTSTPAQPDAARPKPVIVLDASAATRPATGPPAKVGIPECDRYLAEHHRCITQRMPAALRPMALEGLASTGRAWKRAVDRGSDIARLRLSCETTSESTSKAMAPYRCKYSKPLQER